MELIETSTFRRQITALLSDEECGAFQSRLANPGLGALIKGGGGIRKIRVAVGWATLSRPLQAWPGRGRAGWEAGPTSQVII